MKVLSGLLPFLICTLVHSDGINKKMDIGLKVSTSSGIVQGRKDVTANGVPYWAYQGIPYAKPPIGNLRFRSPVPNEPWEGVLNATMERSGCVETVLDPAQGIVTWGEEDCLFVNVYTSRDPKTATRELPVLVWIYGGLFVYGNSSSKFYGVDNLIEQDIVLVMFNYRVGIFGFLSTEDAASPGNYGLKDQALVLKWIQQNIKNFGGDRNRVTIFGQSAGAASVIYHMVSPGSERLFHRAIASSGSPLCLWAYSRNARVLAFDVAFAAGIRTKNTKDMINQMRKLDHRVLRDVSKLIVLVNLPQLDKNGLGFGPIIEPPHKEAFLTKSSFESFENGKFNRVPLMMGMTTLETALFSGAVSLLRPIIFRYDLSPGSIPNPSMNIRNSEKSEAGIKIKEKYFKGTVVDSSTEELLEYTSDDQFLRPLTKTAQLIWKYTPLYFYIFSYSSDYGRESLRSIILNRPAIEGVSHLEEQWYIWKQQGQSLPRGSDKIVSTRVLKLLRNFMEFGNPTPIKDSMLQNIFWPQVSSSNNMSQLMIGSDLELTQNYRWEYVKFWEKLYLQYGHRPYLTY